MISSILFSFIFRPIIGNGSWLECLLSLLLKISIFFPSSTLYKKNSFSNPDVNLKSYSTSNPSSFSSATKWSTWSFLFLKDHPWHISAINCIFLVLFSELVFELLFLMQNALTVLDKYVKWNGLLIVLLIVLVSFLLLNVVFLAILNGIFMILLSIFL